MTFAKTIEQKGKSTLEEIEKEHKRLLKEVVDKKLAEETERLNDKNRRQQAALSEAAREIERNKERLDQVKAELKAKMEEAKAEIQELKKKNQKLYSELDIAKQKIRGFKL